MIGIYKVTNKVNNKCYIGQSIQIEERQKQHIRAAFYQKLDTKFYSALRKYGLENFSFETIEECEKDKLDEKEIYWIKYYDSHKNGYNSTDGGDYNPSYDKEIVRKRTEKLLHDKEINAKLSHKEEENPNAKLTMQDVILIRTMYSENKSFAETYKIFENKISKSGFQCCWLGKSWKNVMPEVFEKRKQENSGGSSTPHSEIYNLRVDYMNGMTNKELQTKYSKSYETVRRIIKLDRWLYEDTIPKGYEEFISK